MLMKSIYLPMKRFHKSNFANLTIILNTEFFFSYGRNLKLVIKYHKEMKTKAEISLCGYQLNSKSK